MHHVVANLLHPPTISKNKKPILFENSLSLMGINYFTLLRETVYST